MRIKFAAMIAFACFCTAVLASAQSLGDLAKREKERREQTKGESKTITNNDTAKYANAAITTITAPAPPPSEKPAAEKPAGEKSAGEKPAADKPAADTATPQIAPKPASNEPADFQGRPESFWRQTMTDARQKVKDLENEANVLILRINDLNTRFPNTDDGFKRQAVMRDLQKAFYEQDQNKANLAKAKAALEDLEKEARKSGALPGWLSGKTP